MINKISKVLAVITTIETSCISVKPNIWQPISKRHLNRNRQGTWQGASDDIKQEFSPYDVFVRLQSQEKGRNTDYEKLDHEHLAAFEGISAVTARGEKLEEIADGQDGHKERKERFDEVKHGGALNVVDDAPSFAYDLRHRGEIGIKQNELCDVSHRIAARSHRDTAIRFF